MKLMNKAFNAERPMLKIKDLQEQTKLMNKRINASRQIQIEEHCRD
jgi:hypothetical protein